MSFSNADTGSKDADPYKSKNIDEVSLKEKVEDLNEFIDACKFGMMTTRDGKTGALVSRCMAVAAKVNFLFSLIFWSSWLLFMRAWMGIGIFQRESITLTASMLGSHLDSIPLGDSFLELNN